VLEIAIRKSKVETQGTIFDKCSQIMAYADDVVVTGRWFKDVEEVFTLLVEQTSKMELEINGWKTTFMMVSWTPYNENEYVNLSTCTFETVKDFISWYSSNK